jgi:hypothetical protein
MLIEPIRFESFALFHCAVPQALLLPQRARHKRAQSHWKEHLHQMTELITLSQTEINNEERAWFHKLCNSDQFFNHGTVIFELGLFLTVQP